MEVFGKDKWGLGHYKDLAKGIEQRSSCTLAQMRVVLSRQKNFTGVSPKILLLHDRPRGSYSTTLMIRPIYWQSPCLASTTSSRRPSQS